MATNTPALPPSARIDLRGGTLLPNKVDLCEHQRMDDEAESQSELLRKVAELGQRVTDLDAAEVGPGSWAGRVSSCRPSMTDQPASLAQRQGGASAECRGSHDVPAVAGGGGGGQAAEESREEQLRHAEDLLRWHVLERRLIAYELHDGLVQEITAAQLHLQSLLETGEVAAGASRAQLELVLGQIRRAVDEARRFIGGLRPLLLEEAGVVRAVERLIADQPPGGPAMILEVHGQFDRLEPHLETTIFRVVQEAVANVRRHSRSDRAEVLLSQSGQRISVEVRDWGVGFDPAVVKETSFGLRGIRERARLLRGRALVESALGKGTRVLVDLPLDGPRILL